MTNEDLVILIQADGLRDHLYILWNQVKNLLYLKAAVYYSKHSELCTRCGITQDDIFQECYFAFLAATKAFDPERGTKFTTFLNYSFLTTTNNLLGLRTAREKNDPLNHCRSMDEPIENGEGELTLLHDLVPDKTSTNFLDDLDSESEAAFIHQLVADMDDPYSTIIQQYYFQEKSLKTISEEMELSLEYIRQLKNKALEMLRRNKLLRTLYRDQMHHATLQRRMRVYDLPDHYDLRRI